MTIELYKYKLYTAEIIYRLPDHPDLLQTFIWQELDLSPDFPMLKRFLKFWQDKIDGKLYSVTVGHRNLFSPTDLNYTGKELALQ